MKRALIAMCFLGIALVAEEGKPKHIPLYAVEAEWGWHDGFLVSIKPCNPPAPKDSNIVCTEPTKDYYFTCPTNTIGLLPPEAATYRLRATGGQDGSHPVVYCIIPGEVK